MIFTTFAAVLALPAVFAQYGGPAPSPSSSSSGGSTTTAALASVPSAPADTPGNININVAPGSKYFS